MENNNFSHIEETVYDIMTQKRVTNVKVMPRGEYDNQSISLIEK